MSCGQLFFLCFKVTFGTTLSETLKLDQKWLENCNVRSGNLSDAWYNIVI